MSKWIRNYELKIELVILFFISIILYSLIFIQHYYFGISLDKLYFNNLVNGLIPNVLSIILTVFLVDLLIKKKELKDLAEVNRLKANGIRFFINRLAFKILVFFDETIEGNLKKDFQTEKDFDLESVMVKFRGYKNEEIVGMFNKKFFSAEDHEKISIDLKNLIEPEIKIIKESLKDIYPTVSAEVSNFISKDVYDFLGAVNAMAMIIDSPEKQRTKEIFAKEFKEEELDSELIKLKKSLTDFMKFAMKFESPMSVTLITFWKGLINVHDKARDNDLFLKT